MKCEECQDRVTHRRSDRDTPYKYVVDGMQVLLLGIRVASCGCGESPELPSLANLHRLVATGLIESDEPLTGNAIRFLRKFCGFSSKDFAAKLGIDPATMSKIEHEKQGTGGTVDAFVRMLARAARDAKKEAGNLLTKTDPRRSLPEVEWVWQYDSKDNRWREAL